MSEGNDKILQTLLVVDDDVAFCETLARAIKRRGYAVLTALNMDAALLQASQVSHAVIDLRIGDESGLDLVAQLAEKHPELKMVILTGSDLLN